MKRIELLGVLFERKNRADYKRDLINLLENGRGALVVTPNPEMLVESERDPSFKDTLNQSDLKIIDGFGIVFMSQFFGGGLVRFPGVDVLKFIVEEAHTRELRVLIAGGMHEGDAKKAAEALENVSPSTGSGNNIYEACYSLSNVEGLTGGGGITGFTPGKITLTEHGWEGDESLKQKIEEYKPHVIALGIGHGKQELWLADNLKQFSSVRLGIGIGGAVEFYAGRQIRAPKLLRDLGLEWLYRVAREPRRLKRILTAVVIFPILLLKAKFSKTGS